jgi:uncharacterized membrane protein
MRNGLFEKNRLEAFSDGVIAIIITIMVIELHPPVGTDFSDLASLLPKLLVYLLSFIYLAIYWNNHHHLLTAAKGINGVIMWSNMGLLFTMTLIPFGTAWMGENFQAVAPSAIYGAILLANAITYYNLQSRILATMGKNSAFVQAIGADYKGKLSPVLYTLAILLAFINPAFSQALFVVVAIMWIVPDKRIERALHT